MFVLINFKLSEELEMILKIPFCNVCFKDSRMRLAQLKNQDTLILETLKLRFCFKMLGQCLEREIVVMNSLSQKGSPKLVRLMLKGLGLTLQTRFSIAIEPLVGLSSANSRNL